MKASHIDLKRMDHKRAEAEKRKRLSTAAFISPLVNKLYPHSVRVQPRSIVGRKGILELHPHNGHFLKHGQGLWFKAPFKQY